MVLCISASAQAFEVKFIYFRPSDIWADATRAISNFAEGAWEFYADELERNGFDRKTFNVERDGDDIVVHIVDGAHGWQHYLTETWPKIVAELPNAFNQDTAPWDKQDDVICVIVGGVDSVSGGLSCRIFMKIVCVCAICPKSTKIRADSEIRPLSKSAIPPDGRLPFSTLSSLLWRTSGPLFPYRSL